MENAMLEVRSLTKRFGGLVAVDHMDMQVYPGEVVGLLGDNGAGKSTLIKMVSGVYHPDEGRILFQGTEVKIVSPMDALELGIETLYQDLALAENLDAYSNIFLGRERTKPFLGLFKVLDHETMREESKKVLTTGDRNPLVVQPDQDTVRRAAAGCCHRPLDLLECKAADYG